MPDESEIRYGAPDDSLRRRTRGGAGITREQAVARGQQGLDRQAADYRAKLEADVAALAAAIADETAGPEPVAAAAMEIKSLAGTFGYGLAGRTAASLYRYLRYVPDGDSKRDEVLQSHLKALRYTLADNAGTGDGERVVRELESAVQHRRAQLGT